MKRLRELTAVGMTVNFIYYKKGHLVYKTSCGFEFEVPVEDCGDGIFLALDTASMFRRYIRKQLDKIQEGRKDCE
jgi:hypothetical protein